ncbi:MAG: hypothetical protein ACK5N0_07365 [Synechococcaceae cyanobacterium]
MARRSPNLHGPNPLPFRDNLSGSRGPGAQPGAGTPNRAHLEASAVTLLNPWQELWQPRRPVSWITHQRGGHADHVLNTLPPGSAARQEGTRLFNMQLRDCKMERRGCGES